MSTSLTRHSMADKKWDSREDVSGRTGRSPFRLRSSAMPSASSMKITPALPVSGSRRHTPAPARV